jgi:CheY-like chemotaxis protein
VLLTDVLGSAVEESRAFIEAHQHELVLDLRARNLWVDGDPDRLAQVFSNLLFNSAKYTEPGGRITLTLERENSETVVTVQDNGIGIPPSAFEEVFDMFSQVRSNEALAVDGLGIGLSLVRTLVQRHGGSVLVFSEGLGKGSRFTVRLPIVEGPVATLEEIPLPTAHPVGQRVLVVDDNSDAATSLALLLEMENCEVRTAADGEEALEQVQAFQPELIFMDLAMPRLDGVAATRRIRALPQSQRVRIVALTGWGQAKDRQRTREAGMDHHLIKPVSLNDLRSVLAVTGRG